MSTTDRVASRVSLAEAQALFAPQVTYLDTASAGLPPSTVTMALEQALAEWAAGRATPHGYDAAVTEARARFARLVGVDAEDVAVGAQTSVFSGQVAASLPPDAEVVAAEEDFTSVLFPFLARQGARVRLVPLSRVADAVSARTALVAVSAVQSADGAVADLDAIAQAAAACGARTYIDVTQACGWLPFDASRFDYVVCSAYKWLLCPRGAAFLYVRPSRRDELPPVNACWYAGEDVWSSVYGGPLRLASSARRFDVSPAWLAWAGAVPALRLIDQVGVETIHAHDVALANRFRAGLGLPPGESAIVSVKGVPAGTCDRLRAAGIRTSVRAGCLRVSFHLYNTPADVDQVLAALA
ncbi:class V aminotransferase [Carbonactinospora thermoautotrophica]|uniref:Class V aminotransferase n=1 Tax=Carbonactinospora thermoautotrophica TaxID=1469144 RepID=A0A132N0T3_9ACTN|nr:aminotransferase class V-fold PLP-dependent enzyme [Carbonactinospora thermoautotrophica]KWX03684.1 class V aminotransferase [Carbonactinospora thermoautotrophica]KWX08914.1 class V aminotransferase [Carbonactinospora thermoautotrophica]